ncbi:MAG TPA: hypothetical protein VMC10_25530 [Stellaceae bacterium]|nr:hypothetical protein [Stellaceae bacterium]
MLSFLSDVGDVVLAVLATAVFANLTFAVAKPVLARLSGSQEYGDGQRSADAMLIVFPLLLLAIGFLSYAAVAWGFRAIALIAG